MARPMRIEFAGAVYHLTARGNARMPVFEDDEDRACLLDLIEEAVERFHWDCYAYCLMGNHYHLLVETVEGNLSSGMRHINGVYTQRFNRRHHRTGHLFQGRFKSVLVDRQAYLLELCRYVVLNPVRAGMVERPEEYAWSSYGATAGLWRRPLFLSSDWILSQFANKKGAARKLYMEFVTAGIGGGPIWIDLRAQCILGPHALLEELVPAIKDKSLVKEIPRCQRLITRPSLDELFFADGPLEKGRRNDLMKKAYFEHGYSFSEIGRHVGLHYATVSRIVRGR